MRTLKSFLLVSTILGVAAGAGTAIRRHRKG